VVTAVPLATVHQATPALVQLRMQAPVVHTAVPALMDPPRPHMVQQQVAPTHMEATNRSIHLHAER
jgi:hypothetical protein